MKPWRAKIFLPLAIVLAALVWYSFPSSGADGAPNTRRWRTVYEARPTTAFRTALSGERIDRIIEPKPINWLKPHIAVYSTPTLSHPPPILTDLSEQAQAHAIDYLNQGSSKDPHTWSVLQQTLSDPQPTSKDPFRIDRVLVATIVRAATAQPADHMVWARVFVQPINFSFIGYTIAATDTETVKLTDFEATSTRKLSAEVGVKAAGMEKINLSPSEESSVKTTGDVETQYEKLGVDIVPEFLRIIRESAPGADVVGNTKISLSMLTTPALIKRTFPQGDPPVGNEGAQSDDSLLLLVSNTNLDDDVNATIDAEPYSPPPHCALWARVWTIYEIRHVTGGASYFDESRQDVALVQDAEEKHDVEIVPADDVSPAVWSINIIKHDHDGKTTSGPLTGKVDDGSERRFVFTDYGQATKFAHWVRSKKQPGISDLNLNYTPDNYAARDNLVVVKETADACRPVVPHAQ